MQIVPRSSATGIVFLGKRGTTQVLDEEENQRGSRERTNDEQVDEEKTFVTQWKVFVMKGYR